METREKALDGPDVGECTIDVETCEIWRELFGPKDPCAFDYQSKQGVVIVFTYIRSAGSKRWTCASDLPSDKAIALWERMKRIKDEVTGRSEDDNIPF